MRSFTSNPLAVMLLSAVAAVIIFTMAVSLANRTEHIVAAFEADSLQLFLRNICCFTKVSWKREIFDTFALSTET